MEPRVCARASRVEGKKQALPSRHAGRGGVKCRDCDVVRGQPSLLTKSWSLISHFGISTPVISTLIKNTYQTIITGGAHAKIPQEHMSTNERRGGRRPEGVGGERRGGFAE